MYVNKPISKKQMKLEVFEYIKVWYNQKRRRSASKYGTIKAFNNQSYHYKKYRLASTPPFICTSKVFALTSRKPANKKKALTIAG